MGINHREWSSIKCECYGWSDEMRWHAFIYLIHFLDDITLLSFSQYREMNSNLDTYLKQRA